MFHKSSLIIFTIIVVLLASGAKTGDRAKTHNRSFGYITKVRDGDSLVIEMSGKESEVRLFGIDAPELNQLYGIEAKKFLQSYADGKKVKVVIHNKDRFDREIAEIFMPNGDSLQLVLLKNGNAWWDTRFAASYSNYKSAQAIAKENKIGLWKETNPIAPWQYRKR